MVQALALLRSSTSNYSEDVELGGHFQIGIRFVFRLIIIMIIGLPVLSY